MGKIIDRLPEAWKTPKTADAVMAPSAILLAGAGAAAAILGGLPLLAVAGAGLLAYGVRVVSMLPGLRRHSRIDPMTIADPWRSFVREARRAASLPQGRRGRITRADARQARRDRRARR